jgi:hypothetical protein
MLTVRMHLERTAPGYAVEVSLHASRDTASSHANGSVDGVGSLSELLDGCIVSGGCASVMNDELTFIRPFFRLPAHSSVGGTSRGFVRRTKAVNGRLAVQGSDQPKIS